MFVVLTFSQVNKHNFLRRILDKLKPRPPTVTPKTAFGCKYVHIDQRVAGKEKNWKTLEKIAGRWAGRLVMNKIITIPQKYCIGRAETLEFETKLMVKTACHALDISKTELYERQVGLIDPSGKLQWAAVELLKYCTTLIVFTKAPERYRKFCEQMMEVYGAPVIITDDMRGLDKCILVLSPQKDRHSWPTCPIITFCECEEPEIVNNISLLPQQLDCEVPTGLEPLNFAAALWQFERVRDMLELYGELCQIGGKLSNIRDCSALIYNKAISLRNGSNT